MYQHCCANWGTLSIKKQILQIEHKPLRILTGSRLTSWLFTQSSRGVEFADGGGQGSLARFTVGKIEDRGYKNFVFPSHENKQVRHSF